MSFMGRHVVGLCAPEEDPYVEAMDDALSDTRLIDILEEWGFHIPNQEFYKKLEEDEIYHSDKLVSKDYILTAWVSDGTQLNLELAEPNNGHTLSEAIEVPVGHVPLFDDFYKELTETLVYMCETDDRDMTLADLLRGE